MVEAAGILHLIGPPGAGKTTCGKVISSDCGVALVSVDRHRMRGKSESDAWRAFVASLRRCCIVESSGLGSGMAAALKRHTVTTVKLIAPRYVLRGRIRRRRKPSLPNGWTMDEMIGDAMAASADVTVESRGTVADTVSAVRQASAAWIGWNNVVQSVGRTPPPRSGH